MPCWFARCGPRYHKLPPLPPLDGQHRLRAILLSRTAITTFVVTNLPAHLHLFAYHRTGSDSEKIMIVLRITPGSTSRSASFNARATGFARGMAYEAHVLVPSLEAWSRSTQRCKRGNKFPLETLFITTSTNDIRCVVGVEFHRFVAACAALDREFNRAGVATRVEGAGGANGREQDDQPAQIPRLRRYARALLRDRDAADDHVQDCLERALTRLDNWRTGENPRRWLFTIMHHLFVDQMRKVNRRGSTLPVEAAEAVATSVPQHDSIAVRDILDALEAISSERRAAIMMVAVEGFSYAEAASVLGIPAGTFMSRIARGREELRGLLDLPRGAQSGSSRNDPARIHHSGHPYGARRRDACRGTR